MDTEKYIAAIEISSSKIIGAVGQLTADNRLRVLAVEQESGLECVRYGIIQNVEETNSRILRILHRLEQRPGVAPRKITGVYVGVAGRSMRNIAHETTRILSDETEITEQLINEIKSDAYRADIDASLEIIDVVPRSYIVNKNETKSPVGMLGSHIRASFDLMVCRPLLKRNISRVLNDKLNLEICDYIVTPTAVADLILSNEEKRLGCMLVDMGAETTTVSIYKNGFLRYLVTLPIGSRNITRDITSLSVLEERAEEIKITSGNALASDTSSSLNINGIKYTELSKIVRNRAEEIVTNIFQQINYARLSMDQLPGGIIAVGGGFNLNGMVQLLSRQTNANVRRATLPSEIIMVDAKAPSFESIELISIMYAGSKRTTPHGVELPKVEEMPVDDNYKEEPAKEVFEKPIVDKHKIKKPGFLTKLKEKAMRIMQDDTDDTDIE